MNNRISEKNGVKSNNADTKETNTKVTGIKVIEHDNSLKLSFYAGSGIGLLLGIIMGTSMTPVVATMFASLTTLLAAILGLNDTNFTNAKAVRIGSFGFTCVIGTILGLIVRSHNVFSPSLTSLQEKYMAVGFSEKQVLDFIAQKEFGISIQANSVVAAQGEIALKNKLHSNPSLNFNSNSKLRETKIKPLVMANSQVIKQHSSVLFSAPVELSGCDEVESTDASLPLEEVLNNFELTGGVWEELAAVVSTEVAQDKQKLLMLTIKDAVCMIDQVKMESCEALTPLFAQISYQSLLAVVIDYNETWQTVATAIDNSTLDEYDRLLSLRLAKNTLCGF
ncbi:hypothetical protein [Pseudoalteromonas denitrificans]|uniref:Uncharacterized protein n=1 Tax=Pseudoalteromonas denitrificans DSM 6059 TaxID=1123010 RepID=A0A1I1MYP8_9GAMM|nr:hypothetical protein [Pseudoalteromonas denitrificans]SFC88368.1 hypothetical protein SAMN02745724_02808 [Pseudoalteromonas denitrificans DSM 6059]